MNFCIYIRIFPTRLSHYHFIVSVLLFGNKVMYNFDEGCVKGCFEGKSGIILVLTTIPQDNV